jgi:hypothetical protein
MEFNGRVMTLCALAISSASQLIVGSDAGVLEVFEVGINKKGVSAFLIY